VNTVIPRVQPTRSTITVACFVGTVWGRSRIRCSTRRLPTLSASSRVSAGLAAAEAARTVLREIPNVVAIILIGNPLARCNLRISAQSSTYSTPRPRPHD
jgi:hypothetical protein